MKQKYTIALLTFLIVLTSLHHSHASVELSVQRTLKMEKSPLDVAVSPDGRWIYVLTDQGKLLIYSTDGRLEDTIAVGNHVDGIAVGPWEHVLILISGENKTVQILSLDFSQKIDVSSSPFKGRADAPVVIAVFSDFQ